MTGTLIAAALVSGVFSLAATRVLLTVLLRKGVLDRPNDRSSHTVATPRGGGIGLLIGIAPVWIWWYSTGGAPAEGLLFGTLAAGLAGLSFLDDLRSLGAAIRLGCQIFAVCLVYALGFGPGTILPPPVPGFVDTGLQILAWLWFINLFNFMDGIDGIAGAETLALCCGVILTALIVPLHDYLPLVPLAAIAGAAAGFLVWNWHPARIFLGDVGSIPLGFLLGWSLLKLGTTEAWAAAFILPAYYLADATITLGKRLARLEPFWRAHRSHFYQRAALGVGRHDRVTLSIAALNAVLIAISVLSAMLDRPWPGLAAGIAATGLGLAALRHMSRERAQTDRDTRRASSEPADQ